MQLSNFSPDALFIGFQKSGTTFLRNYFDLHPQISWGRNAAYFMTDEFTSDPNKYFSLHTVSNTPYRCFIDCYEALAVGYLQEDSRGWTTNELIPDSPINRIPPVDEIPNRIKRLLPNCKVLMVIRSQVDWIRSNYVHHLPGLPVGKKKFSDFMRTPESKRLFNAGLFDNVIKTYVQTFGKERVHTILFEKLRADASKTLSELCAFLEVDFVEYPEQRREKNTGRSSLDAKIMVALDRVKISKKSLGPFAGLRPLANKYLGRFFGQDPLSETEKELIRSFYSVSNLRLAQLLDTDLAQFGYF